MARFCDAICDLSVCQEIRRGCHAVIKRGLSGAGALTRREWMGGLACALLPLALSGCGDQRDSYRYRLAAEVETPEGLKTGSSVIEVNVRQHISPGGQVAESSESEGQAVIVDLGERGKLFVLLGSKAIEDWAAWAMASVIGLKPYQPKPPPPLKTTREERAQAAEDDIIARSDDWLDRIHSAAQQGTVYQVPRHVSIVTLQDMDVYPLMARFGDLRDPKTVMLVDPDVLDQAFGNGVRLKRLTIQPTNDPVSTGIEKVLPWVKKGSGATLIPQSGPVSLIEHPDAQIVNYYFHRD